MTTTDTSWETHAAMLAATLTESGDLHDPAWAAAIAATPRHRLVPIAYQQEPDGSWSQIDTTGAEGLALVYSLTTLVTEVDTEGRAVSSSTKPDLMVRMLETLDVHDGHRVLEIGTGTGYNAVLLAHRLGEANVFSVDVDTNLITAAMKRLADIGCHPRLAARDGINGWPERGPYQRIIVTCAVPRIPWAWAQQLLGRHSARRFQSRHRCRQPRLTPPIRRPVGGPIYRAVGSVHGYAPQRRHHP
jgi:protein-L-isoaspartate O-methyltransferase